MVDAPVLGTGIARCEGSSPFPGTLGRSSYLLIQIRNALIAQLVEQLPFKETVAGSNPAKRTIEDITKIKK